jgi:hypothetical protein
MDKQENIINKERYEKTDVNLPFRVVDLFVESNDGGDIVKAEVWEV